MDTAENLSRAANRPRLDERSVELRRVIMRTLLAAGRGHPGSALSIVEILRVLYDDVLRVRPSEPRWQDRDRFILSKGHGCLALYAILADKKFFPKTLLDGFCAVDGVLGGHPEFGNVPGVEASTGALGHGFSIGVGIGIGLRLAKNPARVFVLVGDGELNEGSNWEAAMAASKHRLDRLTLLVDYNKLQSYGPTAVVQELEPLADKWRSFGFGVAEANGHDVADLRRVLSSLPFEKGKPSAVICHTVKGFGIPAAEDNPQWHHKNKLSEQDLAAIRTALDTR